MNKKILIVTVSLISLIAIFIIGSKIYQNEETQRLSFIAQENFNTFVPEYSPKIGSLQPEVYLVEFLDPECESCREFYPMVKMLMKEFEGKIQLVVRYAPFHGNSEFVIKVLESARKQNRYWEALEVLFQYQPYWGSHHNPQPQLVWKYLPESGVNIDQIKEDMNDPEINQIIQQDKKDAITLGVRGTPSFFINGKPLQQFGYEPLRSAIQAELKK
jgi:protein-disulfide isomerase